MILVLSLALICVSVSRDRCSLRCFGCSPISVQWPGPTFLVPIFHLALISLVLQFCLCAFLLETQYILSVCLLTTSCCRHWRSVLAQRPGCDVAHGPAARSYSLHTQHPRGCRCTTVRRNFSFVVFCRCGVVLMLCFVCVLFSRSVKQFFKKLFVPKARINPAHVHSTLLNSCLFCSYHSLTFCCGGSGDAADWRCVCRLVHRSWRQPRLSSRSAYQ